MDARFKSLRASGTSEGATSSRRVTVLAPSKVSSQVANTTLAKATDE